MLCDQGTQCEAEADGGTKQQAVTHQSTGSNTDGCGKGHRIEPGQLSYKWGALLDLCW